VRIPEEALTDFKERSREVEPIVYHVLPNTETSIGYLLLPTERQPEVSASQVKIRQLADLTVPTACILKRVTDDGLYAITVSQAEGPVWYRWRNPLNVGCNMLLQATPEEPEVLGALTDSANYFKQLGNIWRIVIRSGMPESTCRRVYRAVDNKLLAAYEAMALAAWAFTQSSYDIKKAGDLLKLLENNPGKAAWAFRQANLARGSAIKHDTTPESDIRIIRGALAALPREAPALQG
jgi:hypothetical protein